MRRLAALSALVGLLAGSLPAAASAQAPEPLSVRRADAGLVVLPAGAAARPTRSLRIVGGRQALAGEFPFAVAVMSTAEEAPDLAQFCGGSLIGRTWVLTAAHCVVLDDTFVLPPDAVDVAPGAWDLRDVGPDQRLAVRAVVAHPGFLPDAIRPDVALLRLAQPLDGIAPVSLVGLGEEALAQPGTTATVAGWGLMASTDATSPTILRAVDVPIIADASCRARSAYGTFFDTALMLCAGLLGTGGRDACFGDSGGPLVVPGPNAGTWRQAGIVSFGDGSCGNPRRPGVYTDIVGVRDWIRSVTEAAATTPVAPRLVQARATRPTTLDVRWSWPGDAATLAAFRISVRRGPTVDVLASRRRARVLGLRPGRRSTFTVTAIGVDGSRSTVASGAVGTPRDVRAPRVAVTMARGKRGIANPLEFAFTVDDDSRETREVVTFQRIGARAKIGFETDFAERKPRTAYGGTAYVATERGRWRICVRAIDRAGRAGRACRLVALTGAPS